MKILLKRSLTAALVLLVILALTACAGSDAGTGFSGVWAYEAEDIYFCFYETDRSWKMIDAYEGVMAEGSYKAEGSRLTLYADGQLYLELTSTTEAITPSYETVLYYDEVLLGYMFDLEDAQAKALLDQWS